MDTYKKRTAGAKEAAEKLFNIEGVKAIHQTSSAKYMWLGNLRFIDHSNEVFTETGASLGVFIQPYYHNGGEWADDAIQALSDKGIKVYDPKLKNWWSPDNDGCKVFFISKKDYDLEVVE